MSKDIESSYFNRKLAFYDSELKLLAAEAIRFKHANQFCDILRSHIEEIKKNVGQATSSGSSTSSSKEKSSPTGVIQQHQEQPNVAQGNQADEQDSSRTTTSFTINNNPWCEPEERSSITSCLYSRDKKTPSSTPSPSPPSHRSAEDKKISERHSTSEHRRRETSRSLSRSTSHRSKSPSRHRSRSKNRSPKRRKHDSSTNSPSRRQSSSPKRSYEAKHGSNYSWSSRYYPRSPTGGDRSPRHRSRSPRHSASISSRRRTDSPSRGYNPGRYYSGLAYPSTARRSYASRRPFHRSSYIGRGEYMERDDSPPIYYSSSSRRSGVSTSDHHEKGSTQSSSKRASSKTSSSRENTKPVTPNISETRQSCSPTIDVVSAPEPEQNLENNSEQSVLGLDKPCQAASLSVVPPEPKQDMTSPSEQPSVDELEPVSNSPLIDSRGDGDNSDDEVQIIEHTQPAMKTDPPKRPPGLIRKSTPRRAELSKKSESNLDKNEDDDESEFDEDKLQENVNDESKASKEHEDNMDQEK